MELTILAGTVSTTLFAISTMPMLLKAVRTRDLASYSFGNLMLSNVANAVHSVYVYSLPIGPIWVLHTFYVVAAALMLIWYLRFGRSRSPRRGAQGRESSRGTPQDLGIHPAQGIQPAQGMQRANSPSGALSVEPASPV